jgi:hypothetical protein
MILVLERWRAMFKWTKTHGCNCTPLGEGCEKYILNVGDLWGGIVESKCNERGEIWWESWYMVYDEKVSGNHGGGNTRDSCMKWIEERILENLNYMYNIPIDPTRQIMDSVVEVDENGKWFQRVLE